MQVSSWICLWQVRIQKSGQQADACTGSRQPVDTLLELTEREPLP
jgi:hypothetical protein